jgi:hypothetical protein
MSRKPSNNSSTKNRSGFIAILLALPALFSGLVLLLILPSYTIDHWNRYQSQHWPSTLARVEYAKTYMPDDGKAARLELSYSYVVGNKRYDRSLEESPFNRSDHLLTAQKTRWERYLNDEEFQVFYNPNQPESSFLEHEKIDGFFSTMGVMLALLLGGLFIIALAISVLKGK